MPTLGGFLSLFSRGLHVASLGSSEHGGVGAATLTLLHAAGLASDRKLPGLSRVRPRTHTARIREAPVDVTSSVRGRGGGGTDGWRPALGTVSSRSSQT